MSNIIKAIKRAKTVYICGNGGSASTAEHFTNDLFKKGIKAVCLNSNTSIITMIANDYGYTFVFSKQLEVFADEHDLLITISCSGKSMNIVEAMETADKIGMVSYSFPTFHMDKDYGKLENEHLTFAHLISKTI